LAALQKVDRAAVAWSRAGGVDAAINSGLRLRVVTDVMNGLPIEPLAAFAGWLAISSEFFLFPVGGRLVASTMAASGEGSDCGSTPHCTPSVFARFGGIEASDAALGTLCPVGAEAEVSRLTLLTEAASALTAGSEIVFLLSDSTHLTGSAAWSTAFTSRVCGGDDDAEEEVEASDDAEWPEPAAASGGEISLSLRRRFALRLSFARKGLTGLQPSGRAPTCTGAEGQ